MEISSSDFARSFGDALRNFLNTKGITPAAAARQLGVERATLSTYWTERDKGERAKARVELLFRACTELGFEFEYNGYRITAEAIGAKAEAIPKSHPKQLQIDFEQDFELANEQGSVSLNLKRKSGQLEFSVRLQAAS